MTQTFTKLTFNSHNNQYQSLPSSILDTSASKKRLFVRKPGPNTPTLPTEKQRKPTSSPHEIEESTRQSEACQKPKQIKPKQQPKKLRVQRHTQSFKKDSLIGNPFLPPKQPLYTSRESKLDFFAGLKYIQRTAEKCKAQNGSTKFPIILTSDLQIQHTSNLDDTTDNSLKSQRTKNPDHFINYESESYRAFQSSEKFQDGVGSVSCRDFVVTSEDETCFYCQNTRKLNKTLQQKCLKLQQQLATKQHDIIILSQKLQTLKQQLHLSSSQQAKSREQSYLRQMQIYQECSARYEALRKQHSRVAERYKYLEIENGVLARYKQDCNEARKDYQRIKLENDSLKKQISTICRMGQKYNNGKKSSGVEQQKQKEYHVPKSPYLKMQHKEEDTISLELSEASYQHL